VVACPEGGRFAEEMPSRWVMVVRGALVGTPLAVAYLDGNQ